MTPTGREVLAQAGASDFITEADIDAIEREAVDAFIRDTFAGAYDGVMTSPWDADLDGEAIADKIAELRK